jgi:hypothetical protein
LSMQPKLAITLPLRPSKDMGMLSMQPKLAITLPLRPSRGAVTFQLQPKKGHAISPAFDA